MNALHTLYTRSELLAFWMVALDSSHYEAADAISDAIDACDAAADRTFAETSALDDAAFADCDKIAARSNPDRSSDAFIANDY